MDDFSSTTAKNDIIDIKDVKLGYAYVLPQTFDRTYPVEEAFEKGTLFPELDLPWGVYGV